MNIIRQFIVWCLGVGCLYVACASGWATSLVIVDMLTATTFAVFAAHMFIASLLLVATLFWTINFDSLTNRLSDMIVESYSKNYV